MSESSNVIPPAVVQRLPQYLAYVRTQRVQEMAEWVSSDEIARGLGLTTSTVRQDFSHLDFRGISKRGYEIDSVERVLIEVLNMSTEKRLVIIGAGNLGRALAHHGNLGKQGFHMRGIFDIDPNVIGTEIGSLKVRDMDELMAFVRDERIDIGVIAVPAESAQNAADRLILAGVKGLMNLAFTRVLSPKRVPVVDGRLVSSLLLLSCKMGGAGQSA